MLSRDPSRTRPPTDRPLDAVGLELLLCVTQALLAGLLLSLALELGGDTRAVGLPVPGLLAVLGIAVGACWLWWLVGGSGWPLAALDLAVALLTGALWLLSLQDAGAPRIDPLVGLIAVSSAVYGIVAGVFLPSPRRAHWKGGVSQPRRGLPDTRATPARFSPPVQKVVDERLSNVSLNRVTVAVSAIRLPKRTATAAIGAPQGADLDVLATAAIGAPQGADLDVLATAPPVAGSASTSGTSTAQEAPTAGGGDRTDPITSTGTVAPTLVHRIPPDEGADGPGHPGTLGDEDDESDEDETVSYPVADTDPTSLTANDDPHQA